VHHLHLVQVQQLGSLIASMRSCFLWLLTLEDPGQRPRMRGSRPRDSLSVFGGVI
jgi:hypothetical protein